MKPSKGIIHIKHLAVRASPADHSRCWQTHTHKVCVSLKNKAVCFNDPRPTALTSLIVKCFEREVKTHLPSSLRDTLELFNHHLIQTLPHHWMCTHAHSQPCTASTPRGVRARPRAYSGTTDTPATNCSLPHLLGNSAEQCASEPPGSATTFSHKAPNSKPGDQTL